jgi:hypothetical protein
MAALSAVGQDPFDVSFSAPAQHAPVLLRGERKVATAPELCEQLSKRAEKPVGAPRVARSLTIRMGASLPNV